MINKNPIQRIAAIHDLSGFGKASLTVVIPILSSMGFQVVPLPTAVLSTHSKFKGFHFVDLTEQMYPIIDHWEKLGLRFDAIYSGFFGSSQQISIMHDFISRFSKELYDYMREGWEDKLGYIADDNHNWNLIYAEKPL